jgi:radical SAM superfamily enzyme YgiQ (UPF0313 family)
MLFISHNRRGSHHTTLHVDFRHSYHVLKTVRNMKKNILLINPWIYDFAAYDFWIKPLGLLYLASLLRQNRYNVHVIDCLNPYHPDIPREKHIKAPKRKATGAGKYPKETIANPDVLKNIPKRYNRYGITPHIFKNELLMIQKPDLIFVTSMMTYWYPGVIDTIGILRQIIPGVPIVLGGNYVNLCKEHAEEFSGADIIISGEGEKIIQRLLHDVLGDDPQCIPDVTDLDSYPYPAFDLILNKDQVPIMTSKGCPFRCTYCASHLLNDDFRIRDPIKVVDEIEFWNKKYGVSHFSFYDDALLVNSKDRVIPMLREILKRNLNCNFHCPNGLHLRDITEELSTLLYKARFQTIRFGFETASPNRQIESGGKITNEETKAAITHLRNAGYNTDEIGMYILCGLPGQTATEVRDSIQFIKSCGAKPVIAEYSPIPRTFMWEEAVKAARYDINNEPLFHNNTLLPCGGDQLSHEMYQELKMLTRQI